MSRTIRLWCLHVEGAGGEGGGREGEEGEGEGEGGEEGED